MLVVLASVSLHGIGGAASSLPLINAAVVGDLTAVKELLSLGEDANQRDAESGLTPLHVLAVAEHSPLIAQALAKAGADVDALDNEGSPVTNLI